MWKSFFISLFLIFYITNIWGQEYLIDLQSNLVLNNRNYKKLKSSNPYLELPFIDDFSNNSVYPNTNLWSDNYVFINNNYGIGAYSKGIATFDGLDAKGIIYEHLSHIPYGADTLTSLPIRLDSITQNELKALSIADSIYFSFMYQPQGNGSIPETGDSLSLDFYSPLLNEWVNIWHVPGESYNSFFAKHGKSFVNIMINISDSIYLQKGFKFRFRNRVSLINQNSEPSWASNNDHWNIDYVYLSNNRTINNQGLLDIGFTDRIISMIKNYTAVPWKHYKSHTNNITKDSISLIYKNNHTANTQITRSFKLEDMYDNSIVLDVNGGAQNIDSLEKQTWTTNFAYDFRNSASNKDSNSFKITQILLTSAIADQIKQNDTNVFYQDFFNYYAYDDGSAEKGYGLNYDNAKTACEFEIYKSDILRGVEIFFNNVKDNFNEYDFDLVVWQSLNPEIILYEKKLLLPVTNNGLNKFSRYVFDDIVNVNIANSNKIYVGVIQSTRDNLNIGFDINTNNKSKILYNVGYGWQNTSFDGSLMIRPLFGKEVPLSNEDNLSINKNTLDFSIFPNPCNNVLTLRHNIKNYEVKIIDLLGRIIYQKNHTQQNEININLSNLEKGMYNIVIIDNISKNIKTQKFIKE